MAISSPHTADTFTRTGLGVTVLMIRGVTCGQGMPGCTWARVLVLYLGTWLHRDTVTFITPPDTQLVPASARPTQYSGYEASWGLST